MGVKKKVGEDSKEESSGYFWNGERKREEGCELRAERERDNEHVNLLLSQHQSRMMHWPFSQVM